MVPAPPPSVNNQSWHHAVALNPSLVALKGSIEHAAQQLEAYRSLLEKEVIASFDRAVQQKDLGTMAECAQVMTQFERGQTTLMQVIGCLCIGHETA